MDLGEDMFIKCSYCGTVYYFKPEDDDDPNCPMCGTGTGHTANDEDIKKAKLAECLRDSDGALVTDEILDIFEKAKDSRRKK
ncbi:unnamed protein product [marine sediment metagenome]|uniref:Uncharacterized protein n=1 Tax=marine sediment metagenome TaxID=412755 RepID=X1B924_9ZZZZ